MKIPFILGELSQLAALQLLGRGAAPAESISDLPSHEMPSGRASASTYGSACAEYRQAGPQTL